MNRETALAKLRELARMVKFLKKLAWKKSALQIDFRLTGSVLLESGIERLAQDFNLKVETEPFTDDAGEMSCVFKVIRLGEFEILQVEDTPDPET